VRDRCLIFGVVACLSGCAASGAVGPRGPIELATRVPDVAVARAYLERSADSEDPTLRAEALAHLIALDGAPAGGSWAARTAWDPEDWVRRRGVRAWAARLPEPESLAQLKVIAGRESVSPTTRCVAVAAMGSISAPQLRDALAAEAERGTEPGDVAPLALAAAILGHSGAAERLIEVVRTGELPLEPDFLSALGASGRVEVVPALAEAVEQAEEMLQVPLAVAAFGLDPVEGRALLEKTLRSSDEERRLDALDALVDLGTAPALRLVGRVAQGSGSENQRAARVALIGRVGLSGALAYEAMVDGDRTLRARAVAALARVAAHPSTIQRDRVSAHRVVLGALADPDVMVVRAAVEGLVRLGDPVDTPALAALIGTDVDRVGIWAASGVIAGSKGLPGANGRSD